MLPTEVGGGGTRASQMRADDGTSGDEGNSSGAKPEGRNLKANWKVIVVGQIPYPKGPKLAVTDCGCLRVTYNRWSEDHLSVRVLESVQ